MIGFYLTLTKGEATPCAVRRSTYESLAQKNAPPHAGLHILDDDRTQLFQKDDSTLLSVGTLIFRNVWKGDALEKIARELADGRSVEEVAAETRGQFCLVVLQPDALCVVTDGLGVFPVYRIVQNGTVQISNVFPLLVGNNRVTFDRQAVAEYLSLRHPVDATLISEIERLEGGIVYRFGKTDSERCYTEGFADLRPRRLTDLGDLSRKVEETLAGNLSFLKPEDRIFADITGGFDTRTNAAIFTALGLRFEGGHCGEQVLNESSLAVKVARALDVKFHTGIKISELEQFRQNFDFHKKIFAGIPLPFHSTELINYYHFIARSHDIHVAGFGGTQQLIQDMKRLTLFSRKLDPKSLCLKYFPLSDLFVDSFITPRSYFESIRHKIDRLLGPLNDPDFDKAASYFRLLTFSRNYHGTLFGAHNTIMPLYSPYEERNLLRITIESAYELKEFHNIQRTILTKLVPEVSRIGTSHGYGASTEPGAGVGTLKKWSTRSRNQARRLIYSVKPVFDAMQAAHHLKQRIRPVVRIGEIQRSFWTDEVNKNWSDDMPILEIIDSRKLAVHAATKPFASRIRAQLIYLNHLATEYGVGF